MRKVGQNPKGRLAYAALIAGVFASPAMAQQLGEAFAPAEIPPATYADAEYVDSLGCVYVRAGIGGSDTWVPRVTAARQPVCGMEPSLGPEALAELGVPMAQDPAAEETAQEGVITAEAEGSSILQPDAPLDAAPSLESAAVLENGVEQPTTVASAEPQSIVMDPAWTPVAAMPSSARGAPAYPPAPLNNVRSRPRVVILPPLIPTQQRRVNVAQICNGRTGVQTGYISSQTGQPIDCGVGVQPTPAAQRPQQPSSRTDGNVFARIGEDLRRPQEFYSSPLDSAPGRATAPTATVTAVRSVPQFYSNALDAAPGTIALRRQ